MTQRKGEDNGKVTLAKIGQKLDDHIEVERQFYTDMKAEIKCCHTKISDVKDILSKGEGKIAQNRDAIIDVKEDIDKHVGNHWKMITLMVTVSSVIATVISIILTHI